MLAGQPWHGLTLNQFLVFFERSLDMSGPGPARRAVQTLIELDRQRAVGQLSSEQHEQARESLLTQCGVPPSRVQTGRPAERGDDPVEGLLGWRAWAEVPHESEVEPEVEVEAEQRGREEGEDPAVLEQVRELEEARARERAEAELRANVELSAMQEHKHELRQKAVDEQWFRIEREQEQRTKAKLLAVQEPQSEQRHKAMEEQWSRIEQEKLRVEAKQRVRRRPNSGEARWFTGAAAAIEAGPAVLPYSAAEQAELEQAAQAAEQLELLMSQRAPEPSDDRWDASHLAGREREYLLRLSPGYVSSKPSLARRQQRSGRRGSPLRLDKAELYQQYRQVRQGIGMPTVSPELGRCNGPNMDRMARMSFRAQRRNSWRHSLRSAVNNC